MKDGMAPKESEKKQRKKKKKLEEPGKSQGGQKEGMRMTKAGVMIIDEEDDVCSALKCLRPTGGNTLNCICLPNYSTAFCMLRGSLVVLWE